MRTSLSSRRKTSETEQLPTAVVSNKIPVPEKVNQKENLETSDKANDAEEMNIAVEQQSQLTLEHLKSEDSQLHFTQIGSQNPECSSNLIQAPQGSIGEEYTKEAEANYFRELMEGISIYHELDQIDQPLTETQVNEIGVRIQLLDLEARKYKGKEQQFRMAISVLLTAVSESVASVQ